jgi:hypothetical protein
VHFGAREAGSARRARVCETFCGDGKNGEGCEGRRCEKGDWSNAEGRRRRRRSVTGIVTVVMVTFEVLGWWWMKVGDAQWWMTKRAVCYFYYEVLLLLFFHDAPFHFDHILD